MKFLKTVVVKVADLVENMFVRKALDSDHVFMLAELMENGVAMRDRIKINDQMVVIDGRHRKHAYELAGILEVECDVYFVKDETEMIAEAYRANTGGSKPPTTEDTDHTVMLLLQRGESMKRIGELLAIPVSLARKYAADVKSRMDRVALQTAMTAVTEGGLTCAKAAELHKVDVEKLKELLSGKRKNRKVGVGDIKHSITESYKSVGLRNASIIRKLINKFEDGDVSQEQMIEIFDHVDQLHKRHIKSITDWRRRFDATAMALKDQAVPKSA